MRLTELFRQAAESDIVVTAHGVNRGEMPALQSPQQRLLLPARRRSPGRAAADRRPGRPPPARQIRLRSCARHPGALADVSRPRGRHRAQRRAAGAAESPASGPVAFGEHTLRTGDKVMQVRNNYDKGAGGVFNGDLGRIVDVTDERQVGGRLPR